MSIMDFFKAAPVQQPAAQQPAQQQPAATVPPATTPPNGNHSTTATPNQPVNPLDAYSNLYNNASKPTQDTTPRFALDDETVNKVAGTLDFTKGIAPELLTKALTGDAQALLDVMQSVGRSSYTTAIQHTSALTDRFVDSRLDHEGKSLGSKVRSELTNSALSANPQFNHPVVKAELKRIAEKFQAEHPDATPADIAEKSVLYFKQVQEALSPTQSTSAENSKKEVDWEEYFK